MSLELKTKVKGFKWSIDFVGVISPVYILEGVDGDIELPLKSYTEVSLGDTVLVTKVDGKFILLDCYDDSEPLPSPPKVCPFCNSRLSMKKKQLKCNNFNCSGIFRQELYRYVNVLGLSNFLSTELLDRLVKKSLVLRFVDLHIISMEDLLTLGLKVRDCKRILRGIYSKRNISTLTVLEAIGLEKKLIPNTITDSTKNVWLIFEEVPLIEELIDRDSLSELVKTIKEVDGKES